MRYTCTFSVFVGAIRNDIYLTLVSAEFDRGRKKSEKNVEVQVSVFDSRGNLIPVSRIQTMTPTMEFNAFTPVVI